MDDSGRSQEEWNARYASGRPPWDLGTAPPILKDLIRSLGAPDRKVFVPCAGIGHDAIAWAAAGHPTIAVDFASLAVDGARELARQQGTNLTVLQANLFHLPNSLKNSFDIVWEQTCLAALQPGLRNRYFRSMAWVLKPEGVFWGLVWNHGRAGGPPYDITVDLMAEVSAPCFRLDEWRRLDASDALRRSEILVKLTKTTFD